MSSFSDYRIIKQTAQTFLLTSVERSDAVVVQLYPPSWSNNKNEITKTFYRIKKIFKVKQACIPLVLEAFGIGLIYILYAAFLYL
jgi:hypothetical protein